jgi:hypothetical protein
MAASKARTGPVRKIRICRDYSLALTRCCERECNRR